MSRIVPLISICALLNPAGAVRGDEATPARTIAVVQAWEKPEAAVDAILDRVKRTGAGRVVALEPIDHSWEPRAAPGPQ
jgi:hypothetical protein